MGIKHRWTFAEDKYCCKKYLEYYVINNNSKSLEQFLDELEVGLSDILRTSLRMKIQNIKQILIEIEIEDTLILSPLKNYSIQNKKAMLEVLREMKIIN